MAVNYLRALDGTAYGIILLDVVARYEASYHSCYANSAYRFVRQRRDAQPNPERRLRLPATDDTRSRWWINVAFSDDAGLPDLPPGTLAETVNILRPNSRMAEAYIYLSPRLCNVDAEMITECLAHEWLEAMRRFISPEMAENIIPDSRTVECFNRLGVDAPWIDTKSYLELLETAMNSLLVSRRVVLKHACVFWTDVSADGDPNANLQTLLENLRKDPARLGEFVDAIAREEHVPSATVRDRLVEIIQGTN